MFVRNRSDIQMPPNPLERIGGINNRQGVVCVQVGQTVCYYTPLCLRPQ